jgi:hypothetical protein
MSFSNSMRNGTAQLCVANNSVPAELRVLSWEDEVVMARLFSKEGSRKHVEGLPSGDVVSPLFIIHLVL